MKNKFALLSFYDCLKYELTCFFLYQGQGQLSVELPSPEKTVEANESIISLLLKLHSHLSGIPDSFNPDEPEVNPDSRIGDGPFFVSKVLHRIMALDTLCRYFLYIICLFYFKIY